MPFVEVSEKNAKAILARYVQGIPMWQLKEEYGYSRPVLRRVIEAQGGKIRPRGRFKGRRVASEPVLSLKLAQLRSVLAPKDEPDKPLNSDVIKTIVDYALRHNDGRTFRKIDRRYNYDGALSQFRREHLEASYYVMGRLWRAVYRAVLLEREGRRRVQAADFGVATKDVNLCLSVLKDEDRTKILAWVDKTGDYVHLPNEDGVQRVVAECEKVMKSIVGSKLRFIYKYDPAFEQEDLVSYLRVVAYRVAVKYDWEKIDGAFAYLKCLNYTKRSLWNAAYLLIKENTSEDYKRLAQVGTGEREYQVTTISMDSSPDCDIDDWLSMEQVLGEAPDTSVEVLELVDLVADEKLLKYLRLEFEDVPEFSEFVMTETGTEENTLYNEDYKQWRKLAMKFAGLLKAEDRLKYKRLIRKEMGLWDNNQLFPREA